MKRLKPGLNVTNILEETKRIQAENTLKMILIFVTCSLAPSSMGIRNRTVSLLKLTFSAMLLDSVSLSHLISQNLLELGAVSGRELSFH